MTKTSESLTDIAFLSKCFLAS